ncbi:ferredoxin [bacterium]|nr:ferredoxin [bacterium]
MDDFLERKIGGLMVRIDRGQCIGTTNCIKVAGDVFVLDGERICSFVGEPARPERERLIEACRVCPVQALIVIDENGNQIVP